MANGDIDVYVRFKSFLPGGGYDSSGRAVQGKTNVRGRIGVTYAKGGVTLKATDIGLETVDNLQLTLEEPFPTPDPGSARRSIGYSLSANQFYVSEQNQGGDGDEAKDDEIDSGETLGVSFDAFGDAAHAPELL